ncbi:MAG TPA: hypothetical protein PLQ44_02370 [Candidatus Paceibacterota bacterium]|nr:hypothetical protein [Candidatus Paceibacterota bacterium]HPT40424.1 hypothetical protein [Candidatus Paceibacterota bacterium]
MQEVKNDKKQEQNLEIDQSITREEDLPMMGQDVNSESEIPLNDNQEKSKIYFVELIFIFPILIVADIFDIFSLTGIGAVLSWAADMIATGVTTVWLFWKGRRVEWNLIANLLEFIPAVDILPIRTTMMIILLAKDSKMGKKALKKVEKVIDKTPTGKAMGDLKR